jgi:hypothetical protein
MDCKLKRCPSSARLARYACILARRHALTQHPWALAVLLSTGHEMGNRGHSARGGLIRGGPLQSLASTWPCK